MTFNKIFKESWRDYKTNFKSIFLIVFFFFIIPLIVVSAINWIWILSNESIRQLALNPHLIDPETYDIFSAQYFTFIAVSGLLGLVSFFISLFGLAGLTGISVKKSKFSFREIVNIAKTSYFRYLGLFIILMIFLLFLFLLFIIPGIIFFVYWTFALFILYDQKKGAIASLKSSFILVRRRWWKVFGYLILISIVLVAISIIFYLPPLILWIFSLSYLTAKEPLPVWFSILNTISNLIATIFGYLFVYPLSILFLKNFYFELKKEAQRNKK